MTKWLKISQLCYFSAMLWVRANLRPLRPTNMGGPQEQKWPQICSNSKHKKVLIVWWWWWVGPDNRVTEIPGNGPSFILDNPWSMRIDNACTSNNSVNYVIICRFNGSCQGRVGITLTKTDYFAKKNHGPFFFAINWAQFDLKLVQIRQIWIW